MNRFVDTRGGGRHDPARAGTRSPFHSAMFRSTLLMQVILYTHSGRLFTATARDPGGWLFKLLRLVFEERAM
jgi:hypothetical protein